MYNENVTSKIFNRNEAREYVRRMFREITPNYYLIRYIGDRVGHYAGLMENAYWWRISNARKDAKTQPCPASGIPLEIKSLAEKNAEKSRIARLQIGRLRLMEKVRADVNIPGDIVARVEAGEEISDALSVKILLEEAEAVYETSRRKLGRRLHAFQDDFGSKIMCNVLRETTEIDLLALRGIPREWYTSVLIYNMHDLERLIENFYQTHPPSSRAMRSASRNCWW